MRYAALCVERFHGAFGHPVAAVPLRFHEVPEELRELRARLIREEHKEFQDAYELGSAELMLDALADLEYVIHGAALTWGWDLPAAFEEVHRSNMSKLDASGRPILRDDGKVLKSSLYVPPDLRRFVAEES